MANNIKDLTGMKFRKLTVVAVSHIDKHVFWLCKCDCGNDAVVASNHLQKKNGTTSCGCARAKHGNARPGKLHPLYRAWLGMRARCNNPRSKTYANYGGRGITVCAEWDDFTVFAGDMGDRPPGTSLDRIDNNGPYSKDNCRWATPAQQVRNTRVARYITYNGETMVLTDWASAFGIRPAKLFYMIGRLGEEGALDKLHEINGIARG